MAQRHPGIGETVGEYKVVELLGVGGLGVVFKVERAGLFFAMKFLSIPRLDGRAKREISVLNHLDNPCCVRYVGSDYWPNPITGHPFIVMEHVPGDTLEVFAQKHNPAARKVTRIVLEMARTLGEIHAKGVFHRDLKPSNVIIRGATERPVLIDFGIASLVGAVCLTGARLPPGTDEYRAPEPLRFEREHAGGGERYEFGHSDELWALGVLFYWLLTDVLPFGERASTGAVGALYERILSQRPQPPHEVNPRVPLAASSLCMTMLAEWPADRFPNVPELCVALQAALTKADDDPAWDVPLIDPNDVQLTTTVEDPALREPNEVLRAFREAGKQRPRRGQVPGGDELRLPRAPAQAERARPLAPDAEQDPIPTEEALRLADLVSEHEPPAVAAPVPPGREQLAPVPTHPRRARWLLGFVAALGVVAVALSAGLGFWGLGGGVGGTTAEVGLVNQPRESRWTLSTKWGVRGNEVAIPWDSPQPLSQVGAAPVWAQPPTPAVNAIMSTQTMKNENPKSEKQRQGLRLPVKPASVAAAAVAGCTLLEGCTGSTPQVRHEPPAVTCASGWKDTHGKYGIGETIVVLQGYRGDNEERAPVRDGPVSVYLPFDRMLGTERMPEGTLLLGTWQLGENRFFGTFTQVQIPGRGTLPVCLVVAAIGDTSMPDEHDNEAICPPGLGFCPLPESKPGNIKTQPRMKVYPPGLRGQMHIPVP